MPDPRYEFAGHEWSRTSDGTEEAIAGFAGYLHHRARRGADQGAGHGQWRHRCPGQTVPLPAVVRGDSKGHWIRWASLNLGGAKRRKGSTHPATCRCRKDATVSAKGNKGTIDDPGNFDSSNGASFGGRGISLDATADDNTVTVAAGAGVNTAGIAASIVVNHIDSTTRASIGGGAQVNTGDASEAAGQSVLVAAGSDYHHLGVTMVLSNSGSVSVGPSAEVPVSMQVTRSYVGENADLEAKRDVTVRASAAESLQDAQGRFATEQIRGLAVQAQSREDVFTIAVSGGIGTGMAGFAGAVSVELIDSDTSAFIAKNARVNQSGYPANTAQSVNVSAANEVHVFVVNGTIGGGMAGGVAGGVDDGAHVKALGTATTRAASTPPRATNSDRATRSRSRETSSSTDGSPRSRWTRPATS